MVATATCWGSAERHLGLLSDGATAAAHFEAALAANEAAGIVSMARMVRDDYVQILLARDAPGDAARAEALANERLAPTELAERPSRR
jgi:hypothetical protein